MKKYCLLRFGAFVTLFFLLLEATFAQSGRTYRFERKHEDDAKAKAASGKSGDPEPIAMIGIATDLSRSTAGSGSEQNKISNGKLGLSFVSKHFYGDLSFAVLANSRESIASNLGDTAFFYNNLLLAQNQSGGLSEVSGSLGINKLIPAIGELRDQTKKEENKTGFRKPLYWFAQNFGLYANFRSSNQVWVKDTLSSDILLNATSVVGTLQLFNYKIESEDWGHFQLLAFFGWTTRRLGGNYALSSTPRPQFLGTDKFVFNGLEYGVKMELGPFYGKATFTEFNLDDNIPGFSGPQLSVNLGAIINLDLKAFK